MNTIMNNKERINLLLIILIRWINKGGDNRFFERPREPSLRGSGGSSDYDPQEKFLRF